MDARYASIDEIKNWNTLLAQSGHHVTVFSTHEYGEIKKLTHYTPLHIMVDSAPILVLEKKIWPLGVFWYLPKGPATDSVADLHGIVETIKPLARKHRAVFIRTESELPLICSAELERLGYTAAAPIIPSQSTITLDVSVSLDDIITTMPQKGRYAVRRAERDGVTVKQVPATDANCKHMYTLLSETASGQFGIRSFEYYKTYWQTFSDSKMGQLFFAYYNDEIVAGAFALYFNGKSTYKDGASIRQRSAYGASHLLQWNIIQWAKEHGAVIHDLCGSPPSTHLTDTTHPHYNIGLFKTSFNKEVTDYIGCYDAILRKNTYTLWKRYGERIYKKIYYTLHHDYYY